MRRQGTAGLHRDARGRSCATAPVCGGTTSPGQSDRRRMAGTENPLAARQGFRPERLSRVRASSSRAAFVGCRASVMERPPLIPARRTAGIPTRQTTRPHSGCRSSAGRGFDQSQHHPPISLSQHRPRGNDLRQVGVETVRFRHRSALAPVTGTVNRIRITPQVVCQSVVSFAVWLG